MNEITQELQKQTEKEKKTIGEIMRNYKRLELSYAHQLTFRSSNHQPTTGSFREEVWKSLFSQMIPKKFQIEQGVFIIDSHGRLSDEVDLAVFDENYTPYIFKYGKIKFIPIEAVAVAVQCKSTSIKGAEKWATSITRLQTDFNSVTRINNGLIYNHLKMGKKQSQTSTRPILILCSMVEDGNPADPHKKHTETGMVARAFDIILNVDGNNRLTKVIPNQDWDYNDWYWELNHYNLDRYENESDDYRGIAESGVTLKKTLKDLEIDPEGENAILSLTLQLNQMLMLINNPLFFPHLSYANMFKVHMAAIRDAMGGYE